MKEACILGGSGFLGSPIAYELATRGYRVRIVDVDPPRSSNEDFDFVQGSLEDTQLLRQAIKGCAVVFNCAAVADIATANSAPKQCLQTNVVGVINSVEAAVSLAIPRYVLASSLYVGGDRGGFYRISKACAEDVVRHMCNDTDTEYGILRFGSLYGPGAQEWNGLRRMVVEALESGRLVYHGDPASRRDYIHVVDAARLSADTLDPRFANRTVLISGVETFRAEDVLDLIAELLKVSAPKEFPATTAEHHYTMTPYSLKGHDVRKLVPTEFIEFGQGLLSVIDDVKGGSD